MRKIQINQKSFDYLVGDSLDFSFEQRVFNMLNLLGVLAILFASCLGYLILRNQNLAIVILSTSILPLLTYYASRFSNKYQLAKLIFYISSYFLFFFLWIKGGIVQSNLILVLFNIGLWVLLFSEKGFYSKIIFNFFILVTLILINVLYPGLIQWMPEISLEKGVLEIGSYIIIGIYSYSFIILFLRQFKRERAFLKVANTELQSVNEKLIKNKQELEKYNILCNKLFSVISHDMRSLVGNVNNFSELLVDADTSIEDEDDNQIKKSIYDSSHNLMGVVDNMLYWTRMQMDDLQVKKQDVPVKNIILSCVRIYKHNIEDKELELVSDYGRPYVINTDLEMLRLIIRNLLSNAIKFSNRGGKIQLQLEKYQENNIRFSVIDNGVGLTADELEILQDTKNYLSSSETNNGHGTGLGFAIVRDFAKSLGGFIEIESKKGVGSRFSLILPSLSD